jgi:TP901 family phage tail tape measure protein
MDLYSVGLTLDPTGIAQGAAKGRSEFASVGDAAVNAERKVNQAASGMGVATKKILAAFGIVTTITAVTAAILGAIKMAQTFEKEMALVSTVTDTAEISMERLSAGVLKLFRALPIESMSDLTKGLYDIISAGVPAGQALDYLNVAARSGIAGIASTATAVDALTTATNAWRLQNMTAQHAADALFQAVNLGKGTFDQFATSLGTVAPIAAAYGISIEDVLGAQAQLTVSGLTAAEAMVAIRSAITNIINPTGKLAEAFPELAAEFNATKLEAVGFTKFLIEFTERSKGSKEALNALFTDVQGKTGVFSILADGGAAAAEKVASIGKASGAMDAAFKKATNTSQALNQQLKNELTVSIIELGTKALPLVNAALAGLIAVVHGINSLGQFRAEIETLAFALGIAGVTGVILRLLPAIKSLLFVSGVTSAFSAASAAGTGFMGVLIGLYGAARAYVIAATAMRLHTLGITPAFVAASAAGTGFTGVLLGLAGAARAAWAAINWPITLAIAGITALIGVFYLWRKSKEEGAARDKAIAEEEESNRERAYQASLQGIAARKAKAATDTQTADEVQRQVNQTLASQDVEISKLRALRNAVGTNQLANQLLNVEYERRAALVQNAVGHTKAQTDALNAQTNTIAKLKSQTLLLLDAEERRLRLRDAGNTNADAIRVAKTDSLLAGLTGPEQEAQRVRLDAIGALQVAQRTYDQAVETAAKGQIETEKKIHEGRVKTIIEERDLRLEAIEKEKNATTRRNVDNAVRDTEAQTNSILAMAGAELQGAGAVDRMRVALAGEAAVQQAVNEARSRGTTLTGDEITALRQSAEAYERIQLAVERIRAIRGVVGDIIYGILSQQIKTFDDFVRRLRDVAIRVLSNIVTDYLTKVLMDFLGKIGPDKAAMKQIAAGSTMFQAASLQVQAANTMLAAAQTQSGQTPTPSTSPPSQPQPSPADPNAFGFKQAAGSAVFGGLAGYSVGQSLYSTSHGNAGNYVRGAIGGAVSGAAAGAAVGGVPGAIIGGIAGFVGGILGVGKASKEAEKQLHAMQVAVDQNIASLRADVTGDKLGAAIEQVNEARESMRKAIEDAYPGGSREKVRYEKMDEMNALMDRRLQLIEQEIALEAKRSQEDYRVRLLSAQGREQEAEALRYQLEQERELEDLRKSFGDDVDATEAATYAIAQQTLAAEKLKHDAALAAGELSGLSTAVRNAPAGFKINRYIQEFSTPTPVGRSSLTPPDRPLTNPRPTTPSELQPIYVMQFPNTTFKINAKSPAESLKEIARELKQQGSASDPSAKLSDLLDKVPV